MARIRSTTCGERNNGRLWPARDDRNQSGQAALHRQGCDRPVALGPKSAGKSRANSPFVLSALLSLRTSLRRPDGTAPGHFPDRRSPSGKYPCGSRIPIAPGYTVPIRVTPFRTSFPPIKSGAGRKSAGPASVMGPLSAASAPPVPNRQTAASTPKRTCPILSRPTGCRRPPFRPRLPIPA